MNINEICSNLIFNDGAISIIIAPLEFFNIVITIAIIYSILGMKRDLKTELNKILILGLMYYINMIIFNECMAYILFVFESIVVLKFLFEESIKSYISEIVFAILLVNVAKIFFSEIIFYQNNKSIYVEETISTILISIILINIYLIIRKFKMTLKNINKPVIFKVLFAFLIIFLSVFISAFKYKELNYWKNSQFTLLNMIIVMLIIYIFINNWNNNQKMKQANVYINCLEGYNRNLIEVNDSIRCFKHDFNNIVQAINGYIMLEDLISLKKYFSKLLLDCNQIKTMENLSPNVIKNPAIYSLILSKYDLAKENGIKINLEVSFDFSKITEYSYDISRILGILLDNAIEASMECEEKKINIQFISNNKIRYINIENTYKYEKVTDTSKIFEKNFTTKKESGNTGIGLWEVKKILDKNKKIELYTTKNTKMFKQSLEIYENPII